MSKQPLLHFIKSNLQHMPISEAVLETIAEPFEEMDFAKGEFLLKQGMENIRFQPFVKEVFDSLDGRITIKEYFSGDFAQIPWVNKIIRQSALRNRLP